MATHHGKEGVVTAGGTAIGEIVGFTLETTGDVVEDTALSDATKSFLAGRTSFSGTLEMHYDETDAQQETLTAGSSISFVLLPEGNTAGDQSFTATDRDWETKEIEEPAVNVSSCASVSS